VVHCVFRSGLFFLIPSIGLAWHSTQMGERDQEGGSPVGIRSRIWLVEVGSTAEEFCVDCGTHTCHCCSVADLGMTSHVVCHRPFVEG